MLNKCPLCKKNQDDYISHPNEQCTNDRFVRLVIEGHRWQSNVTKKSMDLFTKEEFDMDDASDELLEAINNVIRLIRNLNDNNK